MIRVPKIKQRDISPDKKEVLRFVPLGGLEEIGRNCSFFEYKNEIVVLDVGIQFPEEETPGVDYIIPNVAYLESKKQNIKGIIFTHGHYDHVHALPYLIEKLGKMNIHSIFMDSTNAIREGFSISERIVEENLEQLFVNAQGRIIVGTFASLLTRIAEIIKIADKLGRKVAFNGRSMKENVQIAQNLGYIKAKKGQIIDVEDLSKYKDDKVMILTTGAQGEPTAGLMKIVTGEHRILRLKPTDTVIFSSSIVPGNERSVQILQDNIARQVDEIYNSKLLDIHASGHANAEDLKLVMKLVKPKFVVPVHAYYFFRKAVVKLAKTVGIPRERVMMMDNGQIAEITKDDFNITDQSMDASYVMVDGLGVGDVGEIVLRDRRVLAKEGMVVIIITLDRHNGRILKNPDIISRGFIYLKENQTLLEDIRKRIRGIMGRIPGHRDVDADYLKTLLRDQIGQLLYNKTKRRPMVLPVIIEV